MSSGQLLIPIEYLEVPLPAACFLVRPPFRNKSDPLTIDAWILVADESPDGMWPQCMSKYYFYEGTFYSKVISWFVPISCSNISGQIQFGLICCSNISGQTQFGLICCCNISGQTAKMTDGPGKNCFFFWEELHVFFTFQLILVLLMHIEYLFLQKELIWLSFSSHKTII